VSKPTAKTRALTLRPHEARRLAEHGRVLIVRELKPQPPDEPAIQALSGIGYSVYAHEYDKTTTGVWWLTGPIWAFRKLGFETQAFRCPFGPVGSESWGREGWAKAPRGVVYRVDHDRGDGWGSEVVDLATGETTPLVWMSPSSMPRERSRFPRLVLAACEVKRAGEARRADVAAMGLPDGPWRIVKPGSSPIEYMEIKPADMLAGLVGLLAERWCWFAAIERSDA